MPRHMSPTLPMPPQTRPLRMALYAIAVVFCAAAIGNMATIPSIPVWYASLDKPSFNPPNEVFGPVWGILYVMMAFAFWRVLMFRSSTRGREAAVGWFLIQMSLNALWSVVFFRLHSPAMALVVIAFLWLAIIATTFKFAMLDKLAASLMIPYLVWVSFASVLNASIWWLNQA